MASFTFFPSIPRGHEVRELLRVSKSLESKKGEPHFKRIERTIVAMMERNPELPRKNVYGLAALALFRAGMLEKARSSVCTLRERLDNGGYEVLSNNHRFFRLPQGVVDPIVAFYKKQHKKVECHRPYRINPYPVSVAQGVLAQVDRDQRQRGVQQSDEHQQWFNNTIHRIARRYGLPPDLYGSHSGSSDATTPRYRKMRSQFEGVLRHFTRRMAEESEEHWRFYLDNALQFEFPHMDSDHRRGFIERIQRDYGPSLPRNVYKQRKKVKLVEPELGSGLNG